MAIVAILQFSHLNDGYIHSYFPFLMDIIIKLWLEWKPLSKTNKELAAVGTAAQKGNLRSPNADCA